MEFRERGKRGKPAASTRDPPRACSSEKVEAFSDSSVSAYLFSCSWAGYGESERARGVAGKAESSEFQVPPHWARFRMVEPHSPVMTCVSLNWFLVSLSPSAGSLRACYLCLPHLHQYTVVWSIMGQAQLLALTIVSSYFFIAHGFAVVAPRGVVIGASPAISVRGTTSKLQAKKRKSDPGRPSLDDVERLSRGQAAKKRGTGSRGVCHRLNESERKVTIDHVAF